MTNRRSPPGARRTGRPRPTGAVGSSFSRGSSMDSNRIGKTWENNLGATSGDECKEERRLQGLTAPSIDSLVSMHRTHSKRAGRESGNMELTMRTRSPGLPTSLAKPNESQPETGGQEPEPWRPCVKKHGEKTRRESRSSARTTSTHFLNRFRRFKSPLIQSLYRRLQDVSQNSRWPPDESHVLMARKGKWHERGLVRLNEKEREGRVQVKREVKNDSKRNKDGGECVDQLAA